MKKIATLLIMLITIGMTGQAQNKWVTGKVTSLDTGKPIHGVNVSIKGNQNGSLTNSNGVYSINIQASTHTLVFSKPGYTTEQVKIGKRSVINVVMSKGVIELEDEEFLSISHESKAKQRFYNKKMSAAPAAYDMAYESEQSPNYNTEEYNAINEHIFLGARNNPLSTFSIDVDAASYSNMRRFLNNGQMPHKDVVRIEEMVNYFNYDYAQPDSEHPFSINTEISTAPWNDNHQLVHIGLQGKKIATDNLPASNLVFLLDVSGSMSNPNKLPLLKSGFKLLVEQLRPQDHVAIVVYAGAAGLVLPSTAGSEKDKILAALDQLEAGGSTAGGAGIQLAYEVAKTNFREEGNNRVILATDGDFNIGASSNAEMERLIEQKRDEGVFLTVLGFGMGNYKDSKMETIADKGNGNYAYIDNILEAKKVLVNEFGGTLFTIAKDVKLQVEFNPAKVQAYRLIGYENRALRNEDFNNDKKDAGELGSGHTVTALYEIIPVGVKSSFSLVDELKYQTMKPTHKTSNSKELMTIKFRYKQPDGTQSKLIIHPLLGTKIALSNTSDNFRWSAAVASFGMILRNSEFKGDASYKDVLQLARSAKGSDENGYRIEFINLVQSCALLAKK